MKSLSTCSSSNYPYEKSKNIVDTFISCYPGAWIKAKKLYNIDKPMIIKLFQREQKRWYDFKKLLKFIHTIIIMPPRNIDWSTSVWKEKISSWTAAGRPKHMLSTSVKEKKINLG